MKKLVLLFLLLAVPAMAAMYEAEVVTSKVLVGTAYEPAISSTYAGLDNTFEDVTGQYGLVDPNLMIVKVVADNSTLDAMVGAGIVELWRQRMPTREVP